ncbi:MAG: ring-cleaving dioxygenase [Acidobacteriota bacterium]|nr:ring-cleaving dioxygenase [Acidobacteriota bacterium]
MIIPGIHHVTAIASDPQRNLDFYTGVLGLKLVKLTVNFDDPGTYHFYFGNPLGEPGTILTFFPWPGTSRGRRGTGQAIATAFSTTAGSLDFWIERLNSQGIEVAEPEDRFGERVLTFSDPDGMALELVALADGEGDHAVSGFHSVTLSESGCEETAALLTGIYGFELAGQEGTRFRYIAPGTGLGKIVDLVCQPDARNGSMGAGTVHHVAFRAESDSIQAEWRVKLTEWGFNVTPVLDREYFHSIYFREPGGVLFEIATDPPGFAIDEPAGQLGTHLKLPPWEEPRRAELEAILPKLRLPGDLK